MIDFRPLAEPDISVGYIQYYRFEGVGPITTPDGPALMMVLARSRFGPGQ